MKANGSGMPYILAVSFTCLLLVFPSAYAQDAPERDWQVYLTLGYSSRTLDGAVVRQTGTTDNAFGDLLATGDSMNLGSSDTFTLAAGVQYKRWRLGINYLPTDFSGQGSALVGLGGAQTGLVTKTSLSTDVDVDMLLANVTYDFIQTEHMTFGIGVGFGRTSIDLSIVPGVGEAIVYSGDQPFGFLTLYMANKYKRFLYGFNINGISGTFEGVQVEYSDYTVALGYRVIDKRVKCDVMGSYRLVNFAMDIEYGRDVISADTKMQGPIFSATLRY